MLIRQYLDNVEQDLNLEKMISQKIAGISAAQLETITQPSQQGTKKFQTPRRHQRTDDRVNLYGHLLW